MRRARRTGRRRRLAHGRCRARGAAKRRRCYVPCHISTPTHLHGHRGEENEVHIVQNYLKREVQRATEDKVGCKCRRHGVRVR